MVLVEALGVIEANNDFDYSALEKYDGDRLILGSGGLSGPSPDPVFSEFRRSGLPPEDGLFQWTLSSRSGQTWLMPEKDG